jgi:Xaa-Pro aminopeptidase
MNMNVDWEQRINWEAVRSHRLKRITDELKSHDLDAVMFTKLDAIRYAISFRSVFSLWFHGNRYILIITRDGRVKFLVASGCFERVKQTMPWIKDFEPFPFVMAHGLGIVEKAFKDLGLTKATVGLDMLPFNVFSGMTAALPHARFVDGSPIIESARRQKHPDEIKAIRLAAEVVDIGMEKALSLIKPGITEIEISSAASYAMNLVGSEETPYMPLVCSGDHGLLGYRLPTDKRLRRGELVYMDCGAAVLNGYNGDIARTTIVGDKATSDQKQIYKCMVAMLEAGTKALSPNVTTTEIAKACQGAAEAVGLGAYTYLGIVGHGIGTDIHEAPSIGDKVGKGEKDETIVENEVICLEPGILLPGTGGGHVENMILVTKNGGEPLTKTALDDRLLS